MKWCVCPLLSQGQLIYVAARPLMYWVHPLYHFHCQIQEEEEATINPSNWKMSLSQHKLWNRRMWQQLDAVLIWISLILFPSSLYSSLLFPFLSSPLLSSPLFSSHPHIWILLSHCHLLFCVCACVFHPSRHQPKEIPQLLKRNTPALKTERLYFIFCTHSKKRRREGGREKRGEERRGEERKANSLNVSFVLRKKEERDQWVPYLFPSGVNTHSPQTS